MGLPVQGMDVEVIKIDDRPIAAWSDLLLVVDGEIGEFVVSGPVVTRAYFDRPEPTALAKIHGPDGAIYHRMGDVGYRDERGRLWFCGRKSHRVIARGETYFTIPCEAIFNTHRRSCDDRRWWELAVAARLNRSSASSQSAV